MAGTLLNKQPIVIDIELATMLGLNEAIVLQQIHYWLGINQKNGTNFKEGRYWTFNSMKKWHDEAFPFLGMDALRRAFKNLEEKGLLITGNFNKKGYDRTKWYTIDYQLLYSMCYNDSFVGNHTMHLVETNKCICGKPTNAYMGNQQTNTRDYEEINTEIKPPPAGVEVKHEKEIALLKDFLGNSYCSEYGMRIINLLVNKGKDIDYLKEKIMLTESKNLKSKEGYLYKAIEGDFKETSQAAKKKNGFSNFNETVSQYSQEELEEKIRLSQAKKYE